MALNVASISGKIGVNHVSGKIGVNHVSGTASITRNYEYPVYSGEVVVTPSASERMLDTARKVVLDDITVLEIPYTEVSNPSGGLTVNIA